MEPFVDVCLDDIKPQIDRGEVDSSSVAITPQYHTQSTEQLDNFDHVLISTGIPGFDITTINSAQMVVSSDTAVKYEHCTELTPSTDNNNLLGNAASVNHDDKPSTTATNQLEINANKLIQPNATTVRSFNDRGEENEILLMPKNEILENPIGQSSAAIQNQFFQTNDESEKCDILIEIKDPIEPNQLTQSGEARNQLSQPLDQTSNQSTLSISTDAQMQESLGNNVSVKCEERLFSSITGKVEQIVQIPKGVKPSTEVAIQVHEQLKKTGKLITAKNTVVYLVSPRGMQHVMPATTCSSFTTSLGTCPESMTSQGILADPMYLSMDSITPKEHSSSLQQAKPYVSLASRVTTSDDASRQFSSITTTCIPPPQTQNTNSTIQICDRSLLKRNRPIPDFDGLMEGGVPSVAAASIPNYGLPGHSTNAGNISELENTVDVRGFPIISKLLGTSGQHEQHNINSSPVRKSSLVVNCNNFDPTNIVPTKVAYITAGGRTLGDVTVETTEIEAMPPLNHDNGSEVTINPQSEQLVSDASRYAPQSISPALSSQMTPLNSSEGKTTMTGGEQVGSVTLPLIASSGVKLPSSGKPAQYIPVLCKLAPGSKGFSSNKQTVPVLLLHKGASDTEPTVSTALPVSYSAQAVNNMDTKQSVLINNRSSSPELHVDAGKIQHSAIQLTTDLSKLVTIAPYDYEEKADKHTGIVKAGSTVCKWQIVDGDLTKHDNSSGPTSPSKVMIRLPLGTGLAPSLVTRGDASYRSIATFGLHGIKPRRQNIAKTLKQLLFEKRKTMTTSVFYVEPSCTQHKQPQVNMFIAPADKEKSIVDNLISDNPLMFFNMPEYDKRKIAYAHGTEGLDYTPAVLLDDPDDCVQQIGSTFTVVETSTEGDAQHVRKPVERFDLEVCMFAISSVEMKENRQLALNPVDAAILQENKLAKELDSEYEITGGEEVCLSSKDLNDLEDMDNLQLYCPKKENDDTGTVLNNNLSSGIDSSVSDNNSEHLQIQDVKQALVVMDGTASTKLTPSNTAKHFLGINLDDEVGIDFLDGVPFVNGVEIGMPTTQEAVSAYCCYLCGFCAFDSDKVTHHWLSTHVSAKPYLCGVCRSAAFSNSYKLMNHIKSFHSSFINCMPMMLKTSDVFKNPLVMVLGNDEDVSNTRLNAVWQKVDNMVEVDCDNEDSSTDATSLRLFCNGCGFSSETVLDMRSHVSTLHTKPSCFNCPECHRLFTCRFDLLRHQCVVHGTVNEADDVKGVFNTNIQTKVSVKIQGGFMDWNKVCQTRSDANIPGDSPRVECLLCRNKGLSTLLATARSMWRHLEDSHKWPTYVYCNTCAMKIRILDIERKEKRTCCPACRHLISLDPIIMEESLMDMAVFICKICNYKTMERSSMYRHVKYSYANYRPYICPYCSYASSEKTKVKKHVLTNHSQDRPLVKINLEAIKYMKRRIDPLLLKVTMTVKYNQLDLLLGEDENLHSIEWDHKLKKRCEKVAIDDLSMTRDEFKSSMKVYQNGRTGHMTYQCKDCDFLAMSLLTFSRHRRQAHSDLYAPMVMSHKQRTKVTRSARLSGQHFQCNICHYCCLDRSSMTRHIKYMHMHERPHACPYCGYKNVEKTKVRIHVVSAHQGSPAYVNSDPTLLKMMSQKVKGNYTKICNLPESIHPPLKKKAKLLKKPLRMYPEKGVKCEVEQETVSPEYLVINAHTQLVPTSADPQPIKEEKDDDLEYGISLKSEPGSDNESVCNALDGYMAGYPMDPGDLEDDIDLDLEMTLDDDLVKTVKEQKDENLNEFSENKTIIQTDDAMVAEEDISQGPHDNDDDQADVDWVVETIDTDSDDESEDDDHDADLELEKSMVGSSTSYMGSSSRKRKRSSTGDSEDTKEKPYKSIKLDRKLSMMPVVVVHDIIKQISRNMMD